MVRIGSLECVCSVLMRTVTTLQRHRRAHTAAEFGMIAVETTARNGSYYCFAARLTMGRLQPVVLLHKGEVGSRENGVANNFGQARPAAGWEGTVVVSAFVNAQHMQLVGGILQGVITHGERNSVVVVVVVVAPQTRCHVM
jgi:hypothetical protein